MWTGERSWQVGVIYGAFGLPGVYVPVAQNLVQRPPSESLGPIAGSVGNYTLREARATCQDQTPTRDRKLMTETETVYLREARSYDKISVSE